MLAFPNAKINIGLQIISKRSDGYHNIATCFYPIGWADALEIIEDKHTSFTSSGIAIPGSNQDNLCLKAYNLIKKDYDIPPVHIHLHKVIPIGAGLGGGSSDAGFTIKLINQKFELNISDNIMENYAGQLGSDCAFFIRNSPTLATEKGEIFEPISVNLKGYFILLVYPNIHVSTATAYSGVQPKISGINLKDSISSDISLWKNSVINDFENSVFAQFPLISKIKNDLYTNGAEYAAMSGSGSTVFGIFKHQPDANIFKTENNLVFEEEIKW